jgi:hypothetical protein
VCCVVSVTVHYGHKSTHNLHSTIPINACSYKSSYYQSSYHSFVTKQHLGTHNSTASTHTMDEGKLDTHLCEQDTLNCSTRQTQDGVNCRTALLNHPNYSRHSIGQESLAEHGESQSNLYPSTILASRENPNLC